MLSFLSLWIHSIASISAEPGTQSTQLSIKSVGFLHFELAALLVSWHLQRQPEAGVGKGERVGGVAARNPCEPQPADVWRGSRPSFLITLAEKSNQLNESWTN